MELGDVAHHQHDAVAGPTPSARSPAAAAATRSAISPKVIAPQESSPSAQRRAHLVAVRLDGGEELGRDGAALDHVVDHVLGERRHRRIPSGPVHGRRSGAVRSRCVVQKLTLNCIGVIGVTAPRALTRGAGRVKTLDRPVKLAGPGDHSELVTWGHGARQRSVGRRSSRASPAAPRSRRPTNQESTTCPPQSSSTPSAPPAASATALSGWHPADLAAEVLKALVERNDLDPALVDDVIMGCVMQVGRPGAQHRPQRRARRRLARVGARHHHRPPVRLVAAGGPLRRPGRHGRRLRHRRRRRRRGHEPRADGRLDRRATSASRSAPHADRYADVELLDGHPGLVGQGISAEMIADKWGLSREDLDAFGAQRQQRAAAGHRRGPLRQRDHPGRLQAPRQGDRQGHRARRPCSPRDEGIRPGTTAETLAKLKPAFKPEAARSPPATRSQITDGASAVLIMSEEKAKAARPHPAGPLPHLRPGRRRPGHACSPARSRRPPKVLEKSGLTIDDIDLLRGQRGLRLGRAGVGEGAPPRHVAR